MTQINGVNGLQTSRLGQSHEADGAQGSDNRRAESAEPNKNDDQVRLSNHGRVIAQAMRSVNGAEDVREAKVAALKEAIANGTYTSNARDIAARLLASGTFGDS